MTREELLRLAKAYSNYVIEWHEVRGLDSSPVCLAEFYDNEFQGLDMRCPNCGSSDLRKFEVVSFTQEVSINDEDKAFFRQHPNMWDYEAERIWCATCGKAFDGVDTLEEMNYRKIEPRIGV